ncbi:metal-dependent transcriptional regulator [Opitutales bacterium]|nr:metal-dependent transcriptional regulator [Opitutales bacterium]MDC1022796.1 metal-dependent transcriptional regulator [bacterium]|tara:strand:- start:956 stop:1615 length:660 start_codon:yes stop_codon:yes gene_type:complete
MPSATVENYLKSILKLSMECERGEVPMGMIATSLGVTPGTATSMMKNLQKEKWLSYKSRKGVRLTPSGKKIGMIMIRRHRLLETFLVETLGLDWSEIHDEAEVLEHAISEKVLERLDIFLGKPRHDPHGHPIPTKNGIIRRLPKKTLLDSLVGTKMKIESILDQSPEFLNFAQAKGLMPGRMVTLVKNEKVADTIELQVEKMPKFSLGYKTAQKILVSN